MTPPAERLDSWKAIAAYLRRDERTVRRWEKTLGLPVHRVPGARGSSVFAYTDEITSWLQSQSKARAPLVVAPPPELDAPALPPSRPHRRWMAIGALTMAVGVIVWPRIHIHGSAAGPLQFHVTRAGVVAADTTGRERWRHAFSVDEESYLPDGLPWAAPAGSTDGVVVLLGNRQRLADRSNLGGTLLSLAPDGGVRWRISFDDQIDAGGTRFGPPWMCPNFRMTERGGDRRIAIAAHHEVWWPGLAAVVNERGERLGTFVNAGWIEDVHWMQPDRLLINGYAQGRGGLVAVLDSRAMNGHSPAAPDGELPCRDCGADVPLRYLTFAPSELHTITASRFNRARVTTYDDRIVVRTEEYVQGDEIVDALYEFSLSLELQRTRFSDRYWDLHRALELQGRIRHNRQNCPEREGPPAVQEWQPATGWRTLPRPVTAAR